MMPVYNRNRSYMGAVDDSNKTNKVQQQLFGMGVVSSSSVTSTDNKMELQEEQEQSQHQQLSLSLSPTSPLPQQDTPATKAVETMIFRDLRTKNRRLLNESLLSLLTVSNNGGSIYYNSCNSTSSSSSSSSSSGGNGDCYTTNFRNNLAKMVDYDQVSKELQEVRHSTIVDDAIREIVGGNSNSSDDTTIGFDLEGDDEDLSFPLIEWNDDVGDDCSGDEREGDMDILPPSSSPAGHFPCNFGKKMMDVVVDANMIAIRRRLKQMSLRSSNPTTMGQHHLARSSRIESKLNLYNPSYTKIKTMKASCVRRGGGHRQTKYRLVPRDRREGRRRPHANNSPTQLYPNSLCI